MANTEPLSRIPRRLIQAMNRIAPIANRMLYSFSSGMAEVIARTPAADDTDTVRM